MLACSYFVPKTAKILYNIFMERINKIVKVRGTSEHKKVKVDTHLHSPAHLLADELTQKLNDKKHFGFYLKMAVLYDHNFLRNLAGQVLEGKNNKTPGRLFAYLIKKHNIAQTKVDSDIRQNDNI